MQIVISYTRDPGHEDAALALARRLFAEFDEAIASLTLLPVTSGEFAVDLDGERLHSTLTRSQPPRLDDIVRLIRSRYG